MKLYRYMSFVELDKLTCGINLNNRNQFKQKRTTSIGFCFLPESTIISGTEYSPVDCIGFLQGIVTNDVLVEFEVQNSDCIRESIGVYAHPYLDDIITIKEYCVSTYSRNTFVPTRYALVENRTKFQWYDFN